MADLCIQRLRSGGVITNYHCPSKCAHCLYNCGPFRARDYLEPLDAQSIFEKIRELGCGSVHIGGGEPFLRPDRLGEVLEAAEREGVKIDYVETNASWFKDPDSARALLAGLKEKGLRTLLVSISPFHNERIPFKKTEGAMAAAEAVGISVFPWISDFLADLSTLDPERPHSLAEYQDRFGRNYIRQILERYWIHFGGRALETFRPLLPTKAPEALIRQREGRSCRDRLLDTTHFHIDLYGKFIPGLCSGLSVAGEDLGSPLSRKRYPILNILSEAGVAGLWQWARDAYGFEPMRKAYLNSCDLCTEIRAFLVRSGYRESRELEPAEFYLPDAMFPDT